MQKFGDAEKPKIQQKIHIDTSRTFTFCVMRFQKFKNCVDTERDGQNLSENKMKTKMKLLRHIALKLLKICSLFV